MATVSSNISSLMTVKSLSQVVRQWNGNYCQRKFFHRLKRRSFYQLGIAIESRKELNSFFKANKRLISNGHNAPGNKSKSPPHIPVLVHKVVQHLKPQNGKIYIDMTFGAGGHTKAILDAAADARVVCIDRDPEAYTMCQSLKGHYRPGQIIPCLGKFSDLPQLLDKQDIDPGEVEGVVFDIGVSSMQLDQGRRGFSITNDGELDMRMDQTSSDVTASDVVNCLDEEDLGRIIKYYGEEKKYKQVAHAIIQGRSAFGKITSTHQLASIVSTVFPQTYSTDKLSNRLHNATKTFQALRIFVNNELNELNNGIEAAFHFLKPGGRCAVICFHSLEDRIVKRHFHELEMDAQYNMSLRDLVQRSRTMEAVEEIVKQKKWLPVSKKVMVASNEEISQNPRARSAKLRVAIKNDVPD